MIAMNEVTTYFQYNDAVKNMFSTNLMYMSNDLYLFIMYISLGVICQAIAVFGVITNAVNIVIFTRQGFSDTMNISLMALTLSDLMSIISIMWSNICYTPHFRESTLPFDPDSVQLLTGGWPHVIFSRTTGWITAFISFERCVCVIFPLRVKTFFTRRKHLTMMVSIIVGTIACASLAYVEAGLDWTFFPGKNKTLVGVVYHLDDYGQIVTNSVTYALNGVLMPVTTFLTIVICTVALIVKLKQNAAWRESNSSSCTQSKTRIDKPKNQRVAKMVILLSVIFIASFVPAVMIFITGCIVPELSYFGLYKHIFMITMSISFTAEVINSSINIFVYFTMSSKYKKTFQILFRLKTSRKP